MFPLLYIEHLILCMEKVVEAAPQLPLFYYHIPSMTGVTCECSLYNQLWLVYNIIHEHIVGFVAYKMTLCSFGVHVALFLVFHHLQYGATEHVWAWGQGYF